AEHDRAVQIAAVVQHAPDPDDAVADFGAVNDAAVGNDRVVHLCAVDFRRGQEARSGEDRRAHVEKVEPRQLGGYVEIGLEKRADRSDVLPIPLKNVGEHTVCLNGAGDDVFAEVR